MEKQINIFLKANACERLNIQTKGQRSRKLNMLFEIATKSIEIGIGTTKSITQ